MFLGRARERAIVAESRAKRSRILSVLRILHEHTDEERGLSLPELQQHLCEEGIEVERKALYRDFAALEEAGFKLGRIHARPVQYYLKARLFDRAELSLLIDAVQTSRSITKANSEDLINKLKQLHSVRAGQTFDARIHVTGRVKMQNESIFATLDAIQQAIGQQRDISFNYKRYDAEKRLVEVKAHDGKPRVRTPLFLVYADENYYMLAFDEDDPMHVRSYRVDRMHNVLILGPAAADHVAPSDFDISTYERNTLGMYAGHVQHIHLLVAEKMVSNMIDMFGAENVDVSKAANAMCCPRSGESISAAVEGEAKDDGEGEPFQEWANMWVRAAVTPVFFGQIAQFGGDVRIVEPSSVARDYERHLARALCAQEAMRKG